MAKLLKALTALAIIAAATQPVTIDAMFQRPVNQDIIFDIFKNDGLNETQKLDQLKKVIEVYPKLVDAKNNYGIPALHWACEDDYREIVTFLIEHGADTNIKHGDFTVLHMAVLLDKIELVKLLLKKGIGKGLNIDEKTTETKSTALEIAVQHGACKDIVQLLVSCGADINTETPYGWTVLNHAVERRDLTTVRYLVTHGANLSMPSKKTVHSFDLCFGYNENVEITNYINLAIAFHATLNNQLPFSNFVSYHLPTDQDITYVYELLPLDKKKAFTNYFTHWCKVNGKEKLININNPTNTNNPINTNLNTITTTPNGLTNANLCASIGSLNKK